MNPQDYFGIGERIISPYLENNWIDRNPDIFRLTTPTVLCVGGNDTDQPIKANGYCKFFETICPNINPESLRKFSVYYKSKEHSSAAVGRAMCDAIFRPLYLNFSGGLRPLDKIKLNFSRISIFAHCKGSNVVTEMAKSIKEDLMSFGLSEEETLSATQQIFALHYAPFLEDITDNTFNNAHFFSGNDQVLMSDTPFKRYLISPENFTEYAGCGRIYENFGNIFYYTDCISKDTKKDDHQIPTIRDNFGYYRCDTMLGCMNRLFKSYAGGSIISDKIGSPIEVDRSGVIDVLRRDISQVEQEHLDEEMDFRRVNYHPEQLEKYYASIANFYKNKAIYEQTITENEEATPDTQPQEIKTVSPYNEETVAAPPIDITQDTK